MSDAPFREDSAVPAQVGSGGATSPNSDPARAQRVSAVARRWQRRLADLGGPNTLLWYQDLPSGTLDLTTAHPGGVSMLMAGRPTRLSDLVREPSAFAEARRRAHAIRAKVRELEDERGLVTGFMAIGMATWDVPGARRSPCAPVLLRAVTLHPTDPSHRDYDLDLDQRVHLNPVLVDYLALEHGVRVDPDAITDIAYIAHRFDPMPAFREVSRVCRSVPGFKVADRRVLATFSYAKSPMVADLSALGDDLTRHDLVAALAGESGALPAAVTPAGGSDPGDGLSCFDLDADQQGVVDAARRGENALVWAAPGTGRTQTIAALAAGLAADGQRVLVVAQKRSALTSLVQRLGDAGLDNLVLDLREGALDRGEVARAAVESFAPPPRLGEPDLADLEASLGAYRGRLEGHRDAMHADRAPWGVSVAQAHDALATLAGADEPPASPIRLEGDTLTRLDPKTRDAVVALVTDAAGKGAWAEKLGDDPWARARIASAGEAGRAASLTRDLAGERLARDRQQLDAVLASVDLPTAPTAARWGEALDVMEGVRDTLDVFTPDIFGPRLDDYVGATGSRAFRTEHDVRLPWWTRWGLRRELKTLLRPEAPHGSLHDHVAAAAAQRDTWARLAGGPATPRVPEGLAEARARCDALAADLTWLGARLAPTAAGGDLESAPLDDLATRLRALAARVDRLKVLPDVIGGLDELDRLGLMPLVDDLAARGVPVERAQAEVEFVWWSSVLAAVAASDPRIGQHDGAQLRTVLEEYMRLDTEFVRAGADRVRTRVRTRLRDVMQRDTGAVDLLNAEASRRNRHLPVRRLVAEAGPVLSAARPVWVMSPYVVASVLPPGEQVDVLIVDDASGLEPAHLVSAAARAKRIVIVGDAAHLPPRPFFTAVTDADESDAGDVVPTETPSSALDVLRGVLPEHRLRTQYRSRDERLVALAAQHVYGDDLVTFPGTVAPSPISRVAVRAPEASQGPATEDDEIAEVVRLVLEHARTRSRESLGVLALNAAHAQRVTAALRAAIDVGQAPGLHGFFDDDAAEPFFVKSLERAQSDVRDAVILTVGQGASAHGAGGRVTHRFGALDLEGGQRRLAVALTAARRSLTVVSSLSASDLGADRLASPGARLLHDILEFADAAGTQAPQDEQAPTTAQPAAPAAKKQRPATGATASQAVPAPTPGDPSPVPGSAAAGADALLARFADLLRAEGLVVHEQHGTSSRRIDLAVEDPYTPGRVVVAIEADGQAYARQPRARDRDRLRAEHLTRLGWEYVRVWGIDLHSQAAAEVSRVLDAVRSAGSRGPASARGATSGARSGEDDRW